MKKLYYFSKSKLQFIEIKNFKTKLIAGILSTAIVLSVLTFSGYFVLNSIINPEKDLRTLKAENEFLNKKLEEISNKFKSLNAQVDSLAKQNNELRVAANLPSISEDEALLGVGGGEYNNSVDFLTENSGINLKSALSYLDEVSRKVSFEKEQYLAIKSKLKENKQLYEAIPAIKPANGELTAHGFGMRFHPILHVRKMHAGVDIIVDRGSPVFASGAGKVDFVGRRGGYGLTIEIDHGFGYRTIYAHLSKALVRRGQKVNRGSLIAKSGNSGLSTGPHLHYEVHHNGIKVNPEDFFFNDVDMFATK